MALQSPFKLLEINIISAQDLPPVSKMLRTFAVAYIHPDHKLTTRIDHAGHTNPTWNYKVSFHVDEKFLKQESSFITIEIYNLAWLRDLPIGTTRLLVGSLSPPLRKNPGFRRVSLQICRPSGHLQGTLNLGVQLVDNTAPSVESGLSPIRNDEEIEEEEEKEDVQEMKQERFEDFEDEKEKNRGPSSRIMTSKSGSICTSPDSRITGRPETETETRTGYVTSCNSLFSVMRPLPSEVAVDMKRGVYSTEWSDYGSSIFDNWSTDKSSDCHRVVEEPMDVVEWPTEDQIPLTTITNDDDKKKTGIHRPRRGAGKKKGLFSCFFGSGYGFQFSIICGSNKNKNKNTNKKKNRNVSKQNVHLVTLPADQDNLHRFYV